MDWVLPASFGPENVLVQRLHPGFAPVLGHERLKSQELEEM